jgi:hypothetical protein
MPICKEFRRMSFLVSFKITGRFLRIFVPTIIHSLDFLSDFLFLFVFTILVSTNSSVVIEAWQLSIAYPRESLPVLREGMHGVLPAHSVIDGAAEEKTGGLSIRGPQDPAPSQGRSLKGAIPGMS